jgi:hypothetical protein
MAKYDINPDGVKTVLSTTGTEAKEFDTILKPMSGYVKSAAAGCGNSGAVIPALEAFFTVQGTRIEGIGQRVNACLTGAAAATKAYLNGDEEMVATYQTNASRAKLSEMPK